LQSMGGGCPGESAMYNECRHIMPSGKKCHSPALRDKTYCYYHTNLPRLADPANTAAKQLPLNAIEDARGIQIALTQVLGALNSPYMDTRRAGLLLYGLQIATQLTNRVSAPRPDESVRSLSEDNGDSLAPEITICEPDEDCIKCAGYATCEKEDRLDEDEFEFAEEEQEQEDGEN
jgi:hypothetical protein